MTKAKAKVSRAAKATGNDSPKPRSDLHQWPRGASEWPAARIAAYMAKQEAKPDAIARARLDELFNEAIADRAIAKVPALQLVVAWLRESIDAAPRGATAEEMMDSIRRYLSQVDAVEHRAKAAATQLEHTRQRVLAEWDKLPDRMRGRWAPGAIAKATGLSATTVRGHLEAAGLRNKGK